MTCVFCAKGGVDHSGCATCMVCGASFCSDECPAPDGYFHGGRCGCGCHWYICEAHVVLHSQHDHRQSDGSSCFPKLARLATDALEVCIRRYAFNAGTGETDPLGKGSANLSRFLNALSPGWAALADNVRRLPDDHYRLHDWPDVVRGRYASLQPVFFGEATIDLVFVLAMRSLGRSAAADEKDGLRGVARLTRDHRRFSRSLASWATGRAKRVDDGAVIEWIRNSVRLTAQQELVIFKYAARAAAMDVPEDSVEIVNRLVEAATLAHAY